MKSVLRSRWLLIILIFLMALLAACGGTVGEPTAASTSPSGESGDAVTPVPLDMEDVTEESGDDGELEEMPAPGIPDAEAFMSEQVTNALAQRLGIDVSAVSLDNVEQVEWPDASLGCPAPNQAYAQVITPGYKITLSADGETYSFHTDMSGFFVLCGPDGQPVSEDS